MNYQYIIKNLIRKFSFDLVRFNRTSSYISRKLFLLGKYNIDTIIDVGANIGQYAQYIRNNGYRNNIISIEPLSNEYVMMSNTFSSDPRWSGVNCSLGAKNGKAILNVAGNSESSSFLKMHKTHEVACPESKYIDKIEVDVRTIDDVLSEYDINSESHLFLKIDTQGTEKKILEGAKNFLPYILGVQLELSICELYEGQESICDMLAYMTELGYHLMAIEHGYTDPVTNRLLQVDGLFFKC